MFLMLIQTAIFHQHIEDLIIRLYLSLLKLNWLKRKNWGLEIKKDDNKTNMSKKVSTGLVLNMNLRLVL